MADTERQVSICIEVGPLGLSVRAEYTGPLASIPAAIERMRSAGVLELVSAARVAQHTAPLNGSTKAAKRVAPAYDGDGQACCPTHRKPLQEGRYGLYCSSKAKGDEAANEKGYCSLKFIEE